jgi:Tol biopolymer transport system component/DNA-binding winged helix-turn-helix (wHTH) protein
MTQIRIKNRPKKFQRRSESSANPHSRTFLTIRLSWLLILRGELLTKSLIFGVDGLNSGRCVPAVVTKDEIFVFGAYRLDVRERRLWRENAIVSLSPKTFDLLVIMLQGAGRLLEKDYLIRSVWPDSFVQDANLGVHIATIRKILGKTADVEQFIETVPKVGYRFVVPVSCPPDLQTPPAEIPAKNNSWPNSEREQLPSEPFSAPSTTAPAPTLKRERHWPFWLLSVPFVIVCVTLLLALRFSPERKRSIAEKPATTRPLTSTPGLFLQPAFSPDGQELAYTWSAQKTTHQSIYLQHVQSEDRRILLDTGSDDYSPAWSPSGSEIAFLHSSGNDQSLKVLIVEKQNPLHRREIATICDASDAFRNTPTLSWSSDGHTLVTTDCDARNQSPALTLISIGTGRKRRLTHPPPRTVDDQAAFSPDGALIAFRRSQGDSDDEIYLVPSDGGPEQKLTSRSNPIDGLAWSADGKRIVFSSGRATSLGSIWSLPLSGGQPVSVTTPLTHTSSPTVSPVTDRVAYVNSPNNVSVWRIPMNERRNAEPFVTTNFFDSSAVYSPDGTYVAFRSDRTGANEIWICRSDGSEPKRITHFDGPMTGSPRWSLDGRSLAFDSRVRGRADIYVVNLDNYEPMRITDSAATNSDNVVPAWSHDGRAVYYSSDRTGDWQIWRHSLDTSTDAQITTSGGFNGMEDVDGKSLLYVGDMGRTEIRRLSFRQNSNTPLASFGPGLWHAWTVSRDGLLYLRRSPSSMSTALMRVDLRSGKTQTLGEAAQAVNDSISLSPDGRSVLFARRSSINSSIMILDGWQ